MTVEEHIANLKAKADARRDKPGYQQNVEEIDTLVADLEALQAAQQEPQE